MQGYQTEKLSIAVNGLRNFKQPYRKQVSSQLNLTVFERLLYCLCGFIEGLGAMLSIQSPTITYISFSVKYFFCSPIFHTETEKLELVNKENCMVPSPVTAPKF